MSDLQQDLKVPSKVHTGVSSNEETKPCQIQEILQHICTLEKSKQGATPEIHCYPIPRIFRICPNQPGVEITRSVTIDSSTQDVILPPDAKTLFPEGKPWWAITKYQDGRE